MNPLTVLLTVLATMAVLAGCSDDAQPASLGGLILHAADSITLMSPRDDAVDVLPGDLEFKWDFHGDVKFLTVALFTKSAGAGTSNDVNDTIIERIWTSGTLGGLVRRTDYAQGYRVHGGVPDTLHHPDEQLPPGPHYWAVWAWDSTGRVVAASKQFKFTSR